MRIRRQRPATVPRSAFAGFCFPPEVIVLSVRWYLRFGLSHRDVQELLPERGIEVDHTIIYRWVQRFTLLLAEANLYAYGLRHPVAEPLGHHTGVGTGELRPMRVRRRQVSDTDDGKVLDDAVEHDRRDGPMMVGHTGGVVGAGRAPAQ
jgi:hypothetical protein